MGLFKDSALEAPLVVAIRHQLFDSLGDIIWVSQNREILVNPRRSAEISENLKLWNDFIAQEKKPTWVMGYRDNPHGFFVKTRSIYEYLYDVSAIGMLSTLSYYYYQSTGRNIEDFVAY